MAADQRSAFRYRIGMAGYTVLCVSNLTYLILTWAFRVSDHAIRPYFVTALCLGLACIVIRIVTGVRLWQ